MPATPTSVMRTGHRPCAVRVASHSSATGRSAVPAVSSTTRSGRAGAGRHTTVVPRTSAPGLASTAASIWAWSARVRTTAASSVRASSSAAMRATWSAVLPGP